jgi:signal transduction histidine kinase
LDITGENSDFISIDTALVSEALAEIESRLPQRDLLENEVFSGLLFDLRLFYRIGAAGGGVVVGTGNGTGNGTGATATNGPATTPTGPDIATIGPTTLTLALADASSLINSTLQMTGISALIWLGAMAVFFFISLLLSKIALRPVAEAWDRQRRFIADASHELKTPLTVILANNSLLLAHPNETVANQKRWILSTQAEAQRMDGLVRDLLLLARIDEAADGTANKGADKSGVFAGATLPNLPGTPDASGTPDVASRVQTPKGSGKASDQRKPRIDLSALVRRNLLQFEAVFFERGISLTCEVANGITVDGDEEQLGRLIQILLDNASKYAGEAKGNPAVWVGLQANAASQQRAILRVTNTGDPIAPAMLPHLFERFFRGDAAHSDTEGAGLGLSLAQAIVKAHNGSITVESSPQAGTTFTVSL